MTEVEQTMSLCYLFLMVQYCFACWRLLSSVTLPGVWVDSTAQRASTVTNVRLVINRSWVQIQLGTMLRNNLWQVVYTYVPLSPSSIT